MYTHSTETIYLSLGAQVALHTIFMKSPVVYPDENFLTLCFRERNIISFSGFGTKKEECEQNEMTLLSKLRCKIKIPDRIIPLCTKFSNQDYVVSTYICKSHGK